MCVKVIAKGGTFWDTVYKLGTCP